MGNWTGEDGKPFRYKPPKIKGDSGGGSDKNKSKGKRKKVKFAAVKSENDALKKKMRRAATLAHKSFPEVLVASSSSRCRSSSAAQRSTAARFLLSTSLHLMRDIAATDFASHFTQLLCCPAHLWMIYILFLLENCAPHDSTHPEYKLVLILHLEVHRCRIKTYRCYGDHSPYKIFKIAPPPNDT